MNRGEVSFSSFLNVYSTNNPLLYDFSEHNSVDIACTYPTSPCVVLQGDPGQDHPGDQGRPGNSRVSRAAGQHHGKTVAKAGPRASPRGEQVSRARGTSRGDDQRTKTTGKPKVRAPSDFVAPEPKPLQITSKTDLNEFVTNTLALALRLGTGAFAPRMENRRFNVRERRRRPLLSQARPVLD